MVFTWELDDFQIGREVVRNGVLYIIGYHVGYADPDRRWCLIDLRDGGIQKAQTKEDLIASLNR